MISSYHIFTCYPLIDTHTHTHTENWVRACPYERNKSGPAMQHTNGQSPFSSNSTHRTLLSAGACLLMQLLLWISLLKYGHCALLPS